MLTAAMAGGAVPTRVAAQVEENSEPPPVASVTTPVPSPAKPTKLKKLRVHKNEAAHEDAKKADVRQRPATPAPAPAPMTLAGAAAAGAERVGGDVAAKLTQAGAGACSATIDTDAVASMIGVTQSNIITTWSNVEPRNKHAVNVFVGQRYGGNPAVPYGVTGLIASPNASGSCDSTVVQVVTSPLPCANVRDTMMRNGKLEGDLAGIPLIQSGQDQTLLLSTATNSCVLVGFHTTFRQ